MKNYSFGRIGLCLSGLCAIGAGLIYGFLSIKQGSCKPSSSFWIYECIFMVCVGIDDILRGFILICGYNWNSLRQANELMENFNLIQYETVTVSIKRRKRIKLFIILYLSAYYSIWLFVATFRAQDSTRESYNSQSSIQFIVNIIRAISLFSWLYTLDRLSEATIKLIGCFESINIQLKNLKIADDVMNRLNRLRSLYSTAVRATMHLELFAYFALAHIYTIVVIASIANIYAVYRENRPIEHKLIIGFINFSESVFTIYLTSIMMKVNTSSYAESETLYELSLLNESDNLKREIQFFLYRISKNDVGFTFLNLFVINPSFITSLITLFATFILALPSL